MITDLAAFSDSLADAVASAAPSVVQVLGRGRPATGVVYAEDVVLTMVRALGREDGLQIRRGDGRALDADLVGWDPATSLAVLRATGVESPPVTVASTTPRVGHLAIALARSWSNATTASAGIVSVIGGPLPTGRGRAIGQVFRTNAPMHDGFAGGAFIDTSGALLGITTATEIRGLSVVIPASIAWQAAASIVEHGRLRRGYLGVAGHPVRLPAGQVGAGARETALLVVGVTNASPAATAGVLVGDVLVEFDGHPIDSPEDLLDLLSGDSVGRQVTMRVLRGAAPTDVAVTIGERPTN